jgi:DNA polymerase-3 subunit beta
MKIALPAAELSAALGFIAEAVPTNTTVPMVRHCKLAIADSTLTTTATDLDIALIAEIKAANAEPGAVTAPCARLKKLIGQLPPKADVTLVADGERLRITSGRGRWSLPTLPVTDFPMLDPPAQDAATFVLPKEEARRLVQRVGFAICEEETRYYLNGIYLRAAEGELCAVATDGRRLSETRIAIDPGTMPGVILPTEAVTALDQLAAVGDVTVKATGKRVELAAGGHRVVTKLIDGTYPDYTKVLPTVSNNAVKVAAGALLSAAKRLAAILESEAMEKAIGLQWGDGQFSVCLPHEEDAGLEEIVPISCAGTGRVAVQARWLINQLEALAGDTIAIDHAAPSMPVRIVRPDEPATTTVLMPMLWDLPAAAVKPLRKRAGKRR